jgi:membrane protein DedA with SNARE-associated domain
MAGICHVVSGCASRSGPVVGSFIPGSTLILALSALVPGGELKLQWVLLAAIAGAIRRRHGGGFIEPAAE